MCVSLKCLVPTVALFAIALSANVSFDPTKITAPPQSFVQSIK